MCEFRALSVLMRSERGLVVKEVSRRRTQNHVSTYPILTPKSRMPNNIPIHSSHQFIKAFGRDSVCRKHLGRFNSSEQAANRGRSRQEEKLEAVYLYSNELRSRGPQFDKENKTNKNRVLDHRPQPVNRREASEVVGALRRRTVGHERAAMSE